MGLLDQLWDDTLAGPTPDSGLGKLRKPLKFTPRSASAKESNENEGTTSSSEETIRVSRRIMIVKPPGYQYGSPPISPAASSSTPPSSPFSGREPFRFEEDRLQMRHEKTTSDVGPRAPTSPYDM